MTLPPICRGHGHAQMQSAAVAALVFGYRFISESSPADGMALPRKNQDFGTSRWQLSNRLDATLSDTTPATDA